MSLKSKKGITLSSIVIYVILFFMFTTVIISVSSRYNKRLFDDRGQAINITAINKLEYNLLDSADKSYNAKVNVEGNKTTVTFSNSDKYVFDVDDNVIYKNGGKLIKFVKDCSVEYVDNTLNINITLNKYINEVTRNIKIAI